MGNMINTNVASLSAQRSLNKSQDSLNGALQRLSSGLRINSAKDDAAGLAITTRMTSQINGMNQAVRNANDGISLAQTADSSLDEVTNNLQRIRDLALQAANGTNSADDRAALDVEVQQRLAEVNRIASQTTFNGINLLDGSFTSQAFQIGASANQTVTIDSISSAKTSDLGLGAGTTESSNLSSAVATSGIAAGSLSINGTTVTTDSTTNSAKALAAAVNGNTTITASGVTAVATNVVSAAFTDVAVTKAGQIGTSLGTTVPSITGSNLSNVSRTTGNAMSGVAVTTGTDVIINGTGIATTATNAAQLATDINLLTTTTGVTAVANATTTTSADAAAFDGGSVTLANTGTFTLSVGGVDIYSVTATGATSAITATNIDGDAVAVTNGTVNATRGGLADTDVLTNLAAAGITFTGTAAAGTLQFKKADGSNLAIVETVGGVVATGTSFVAGGNVTALGATTNTRTASVSLSSSAGSIVVTGADNGTKSGIANGTYAAGVAVGTLSINDSVITTAAGTTNSAKTLAAAINAQSTVTGVTATAQTTSTTAADSLAFKNGSVVLAAATTNNYTLSVGGVAIYQAAGSASGSTTITAAALDGSDVTLTNASASAGGLGSTVVQAALTAAGITYSGSAVAGTLTFQKADGSNIAITETIGGATATGTSFLTGNTTLTAASRTVTDTSNVVLTSASAIKVSGSSAETSGLVSQTYGGIANQATKTGNAVSGAALVTNTDLLINGTAITSTASNAKQLAADINLKSQTTGVNATANATITSSVDSLAFKNGSVTLANTGTYTLSVGGVDIFKTNAATGASSAIAAANIDGNDVAITNTTLVSGKKGLGDSTVLANLAAAGITFTGTAAAGTLQFKRADGSDIAITETVGVVAAAGTSFISGGVVTATGSRTVTDRASITLNSANSIVVTGNDNGTKTGIANGTYAAATTSQLTINGTSIATDVATVGADKVAAAINLKTATTGVTATALATDTGALGSFTTTSTAGYGLAVNGVEIIDSATSVANITAATIDAAIATTGTGSVGANLAAAGITTTGTAAAGTLRFLSASGANINVVETQGGTDLAGFGKKTATTANQYSSTVTLSSSAAITVGGTDPSKMGLVEGTSNIVNQQGTALSSSVVSGGIAAGSLTINGTTIVTSASTNSAQLLAAAINSQKDTTQVSATVGTTATSATLFGGSDAPSFNNVSTAAASTYSLSVGGVTISTQAASVTAGSGVTRASIDTALATTGTGSVGNNLALAGITFTGTAVKGDLKFFKTDGSNLAVTETVTGTVTGGVGRGAGVANTGGTIETATAAVKLTSTANIVVAGSSSTSAGFTAGTVGATQKYTLTVGDGATSVDLAFDLSEGQYGTSVKSTDIVSAINSNTSLQALNITASIGSDGKLALNASDGRNITLKETTNDRVNFALTGTAGFADADAGTLSAGGVPATAVSHMGKISLSSTKDLTIAGTDATQAGLTAGSFAGANVKSVEAANATLTAIDTALKNISSSRASLGAYQNRFASTVANLQANAESLTASRSRIMDADFAVETAALSRGQILQQAGTAMLAQANQLPNGVLSLLRG